MAIMLLSNQSLANRAGLEPATSMLEAWHSIPTELSVQFNLEQVLVWDAVMPRQIQSLKDNPDAFGSRRLW
jgi:hypothetical protein